MHVSNKVDDEEQNHDEDQEEDIDADDDTDDSDDVDDGNDIVDNMPKTFFYFSRSRIRVTPRFFEYKVYIHCILERYKVEKTPNYVFFHSAIEALVNQLSEWHLKHFSSCSRLSGPTEGEDSVF